jgi:hypothetical protein
MSGDDSELGSVWDEICVQLQFEQSAFWDAYEDTITRLVTGEVAKLNAFEQEAVWLQTEEGWDWSGEDESDRDSTPVSYPSVVDYLVKEYVYADAGRWTNPRIRQYIDRACSSD